MHEDFDIDSLARYLHLTPAQVTRMADRGRVPARRISGQWRFSQAEIHHWLEERIGASEDDDELEKVEKVLNRQEEEEPSLSALVPETGIGLPLNARTRGSVIREMVQLAAETGLLWDVEKMEQAVLDRESLHPTALDIGVALLHPRRPMTSILAEPMLLLGITTQGIPFGGNRGKLTDVFFLICSTDDRVHLRVLARLSRLIGDATFLAGLREQVSSKEAAGWIAEKEQELFA